MRSEGAVAKGSRPLVPGAELDSFKRFRMNSKGELICVSKIRVEEREGDFWPIRRGKGWGNTLL